MKVQTFGEVKPGTVLALNGAKKYLSIFKVQMRSERKQEDGGNFFEDSEEEDGEVASMVFQEDRRTEKRIAEGLGQQLPSWFEKLYEGMLPRVKHQEWPRMECDK